MNGAEIREGYIPGVVGRLTELHATYYGSLWELGPQFEADIAEGIAEFAERYDPTQDGLWTVVDEAGAIQGGIIIDSQNDAEKGAQLRYFILNPSLQGNGFGRALLEAAMEFCHHHKFDRVYLWTVDELEAAVYLYQDFGFEATDQIDPHTGWMTEIPYRLFECSLAT